MAVGLEIRLHALLLPRVRLVNVQSPKRRLRIAYGCNILGPILNLRGSESFAVQNDGEIVPRRDVEAGPWVTDMCA